MITKHMDVCRILLSLCACVGLFAVHPARASTPTECVLAGADWGWDWGGTGTTHPCTFVARGDTHEYVNASKTSFTLWQDANGDNQMDWPDDIRYFQGPSAGELQLQEGLPYAVVINDYYWVPLTPCVSVDHFVPSTCLIGGAIYVR